MSQSKTGIKPGESPHKEQFVDAESSPEEDGESSSPEGGTEQAVEQKDIETAHSPLQSAPIQDTLDFGKPSPRECFSCGSKFDREKFECPDCGSEATHVEEHPIDGWTTAYFRQVVFSTAGFAVVSITDGCDRQAHFWWAGNHVDCLLEQPDGYTKILFEGETVSDMLLEVKDVSIQHWTELNPEIKQLIRGRD